LVAFFARKEIFMDTAICNAQEIHQDSYSLVSRFMEIVGTEEWFDMLHEDIIIHFPNAPMMGSQEIVVGKDEAVPFLRDSLTQTDHLRFYNVETWRTQDPNVFFNEYHATVRTPTGKHFQYVYVNQIMVKEGKIGFVREYWDPRRRLADSMDFVLFR
jgi:ketosteroid isomerase-like protein